MNFITLTGELGSGKSTVANFLISKIPFRIVSAGLLFRQLAAEHNMSAKEFNEFIENNPKYDNYVDDTIAALGKTDDKIIFDSRMAWHFVPNSFKIYLYVDVDVATDRIFNDTGRVSESYSDKATARQEIIDRRKSEILRYKTFYGCDVSDYNNFDLVVDTSFASKDEINELVLKCFKAFEEGRPYSKVWLAPQSIKMVCDSCGCSCEPVEITNKDGMFILNRGAVKVRKALEEGRKLIDIDKVIQC